MSLKCGIVGLPNVGKSTLFNCLTSSDKAEEGNYPFCTIEPNVGIASVPDSRLDKLNELIITEKITYASISFIDIAGLVGGASKGEGLGNKFLANIKNVDAICHLVRCFNDKNVSHVKESIDPIRDIEIVEMELLLKDIETITSVLEKKRKLLLSGDLFAKKLCYFYEKVLSYLNNFNFLRNFDFSSYESDVVACLIDLQLLTNKPTLFIANVNEIDLLYPDNSEHIIAISNYAKKRGDDFVAVSVKVEKDMLNLSKDERIEFLNILGVSSSSINRVSRKAFDLLNLITYITAGKSEIRAWTIRKGTCAADAAAVIHNDFKRGFIKAKVIFWEDFLKHKGEAQCRAAGAVRLEGRDYIVKDGDILEFRFNV